MRYRAISIGLLAILLALSLPRPRAVGNDAPIGASAARVPVLVELFTSEACSSCPPADALLEKLDRSQPVAGADLIVLSEHVDYWNDFRWKDPFSSGEFTMRQRDYARRFRLEGPYTPQMVADGDTEFVGSDEARAMHVIENAIKAAKLPVVLSSIQLEGDKTLSVHVDAGPLDSRSKRGSLQVMLVLADDSDQSIVRGGENGGRVLKHVAVVRNLIQVGSMDRSGTFSKDVNVSLDKANPRNLRIVAIVQESSAGRVLGLASARLPN